ncbi:hypothetical protein, partial [Roseobacter sp. N2S]|uniref:hypothetical protein n=1 Tax=Roseobacter sp. N2S TaxID=2663844 RepID=UPI00286B869B
SLLPSVPSVSRCSPPVKRCLGRVTNTRNPFFQKNPSFFTELLKTLILSVSAPEVFSNSLKTFGKVTAR